jgi:hypothetical protein
MTANSRSWSKAWKNARMRAASRAASHQPSGRGGAIERQRDEVRVVGPPPPRCARLASAATATAPVLPALLSTTGGDLVGRSGGVERENDRTCRRRGPRGSSAYPGTVRLAPPRRGLQPRGAQGTGRAGRERGEFGARRRLSSRQLKKQPAPLEERSDQRVMRRVRHSRRPPSGNRRARRARPRLRGPAPSPRGSPRRCRDGRSSRGSVRPHRGDNRS